MMKEREGENDRRIKRDREREGETHTSILSFTIFLCFPLSRSYL